MIYIDLNNKKYHLVSSYINGKVFLRDLKNNNGIVKVTLSYDVNDLKPKSNMHEAVFRLYSEHFHRDGNIYFIEGELVFRNTYKKWRIKNA